MKRLGTVAAAAALIAVAGLSGCSNNHSSTSSSGPSNQTSAAGRSPGGSSTAEVTIAGKDQKVQGAVACTTEAGNVKIVIGEASAGLGAMLTDANPPAVESVGLGDVDGIPLGYTPGAGQGNASATKDGRSYTMTGTAIGVNMSDPTQAVRKSFEIDVTCP